MTKLYKIPRINHDIKSEKDRDSSSEFNALRLQSEKLRQEYRENKEISDYLTSLILESNEPELLEILENHSNANVQAL